MFRPVRHVPVLIALLAFSAEVTTQRDRDRDLRPRMEKLAPVPLDVATRLFTLYDVGEYDAFDAAVEQLQAPSNWLHLERAAQRWVDASPDHDRRQLVGAAVALELASAQRSSWPLSAVFVEVGCQLLRAQEPGPGKRQWHVTAGALLLSLGATEFLLDPVEELWFGHDPWFERNGVQIRERALQKERAAAAAGRMEARSLDRAHAHHATRQFPAELAFVAVEAKALELRAGVASEGAVTWLAVEEADRLARQGRAAVVPVPAKTRMTRESAMQLLKQEHRPDRPGGTVVAATPELLAAQRSIELWHILQRLEPLLGSETFAPDAHLRRGVTYLRLAQPAKALEELAMAARKGQTARVKYSALVIAGRTRDLFGDVEGAMRLFRAALDVVPRAQSATFGLAPLLFRTNPDAAAALIAQAVAMPTVVDPLTQYFVDPQEWPREISRLRAMLR